jgi:hypothetical protein
MISSAHPTNNEILAVRRPTFDIFYKQNPFAEWAQMSDSGVRT